MALSCDMTLRQFLCCASPGGGCFVCISLIYVPIGVVNKPCRSQPPDIRLQCNPGRALPPPEDATRNSQRESQQNGYHVRLLIAREFMSCGSHPWFVEETFSL
jgi:hypothetical protein